MALIKVDALTEDTAPLGSDIIYVEHNPGGTPADRKVQLSTLKRSAINAQTANYTLALTDAGNIVEMNLGVANNLTVPPNSTVAFPIGTMIQVAQYGTGPTTIVAGAGVTLDSPLSTLVLPVQYTTATLLKIATDEWIVGFSVEAPSFRNVLYDNNPAWDNYANQEVIRIIGGGGAHPCQGTFTAATANPILTVSMLAGVFGGAMVDTVLVVGVRAGNDPTVSIVAPDPTLGTAIAATGVTQFQAIPLPALGWEQVAASFMASIVFGKSRNSSALTPGTKYIWQLVQTIQAAANTVTVGTNPVTPDVTSDGKTVWVPNSGAGTVTPVSLGGRPLWILDGGMKDVLGNPMSWYPIAGTAIAVGTGPYQCRVSPNGTYIAVWNNTAKTVSIITASSKTVTATSTAIAAGSYGIQCLAWSSDSAVVWVAGGDGKLYPVTASSGAVGTAVTVAAGHTLAMTSVGGTTGWVLDYGNAQVFPLSGMTGSAITVGGAIALASNGDFCAMNPVDGALFVHRTSNNSIVRVTTGGVQSTTVLHTAITTCVGMAIKPDGSSIWLTDYNTAILGFDVAGLQQSYYTSGGPVAGAYGVVLSTYDDICVTLYNGNGLRVWPSAYITCDGGNGFPPNQGVSVIAQGVTTP